MSTNVVTCRRCSRLYRSLIRGYCAECLEEREREYETVREFLRDNPSARMASVAEDTGVDAATIMEFVREGRLEFASVSDDVRSEQERRAQLAEQLSASRPAAPGPAPASPSTGGSSSAGMATRRVAR